MYIHNDICITVYTFNSCNTGKSALPDMYAQCSRVPSTNGQECTYQVMQSFLYYIYTSSTLKPAKTSQLTNTALVYRDIY